MMLRKGLIGAVLLTPLLGGITSAQVVTQAARITSEGAKAMIGACETHATQHNMALAMWVVDQSNTPLRFLQMEGTRPAMPTSNRVVNELGFSSIISSRMSGVATPVTVDGKVIGGFVIGSTGSLGAQETACAQAALAALKGNLIERRPSVSTEGAKQLGAVCEAWAEERGMTVAGPAIWVLDAFGDPVFMSRTATTPKLHIDTARKKAETALGFFRPSGVIKIPKDLSEEVGLYPHAGGYPLMRDGQIVGAFATGGIPPGQGVDTEGCAKEALQKVFPESLTWDCSTEGGCIQQEMDKAMKAKGKVTRPAKP